MNGELLLPAVLERLHPAAVAGRDYIVADRSDGQGARIDKWDAAKLGARPTLEQIAAAADEIRAERIAEAEAEASAKAAREALEVKLDAGTITPAELRTLIKHIIRRVHKIENRK